MDAADRLTLDALNRALLDELLPVGRSEQTVLLSCDDETLAVATGRLEAPGSPETVLRAVLRTVAPITTERGLIDVLLRLTEPPNDLSVLCACALAASRMRPDEQHSTHAYYSRLCEVLGIAPRDQWPAVAGFEQIPARFQALARWTANTDRGLLRLPAHPIPALVGVPISQALLRRVDRDRLGELFDKHGFALALGRDPLRIVRASSLRHQLTSPAQRLLDRRDFDEPLRAAITAAFHSWDGTVVDGGGRRLTIGRLRLGISPARLTLNLSQPEQNPEMEFRGPDGDTVLLPKWPAELPIPLEWLSHAMSGPVVGSGADGRLIKVLPGQTMLFDVNEKGFWLTSAARDESTVILLTNANDFLFRDWGRRKARLVLPKGWVLVCDVRADELPQELRETAGEDELDAVGDVLLDGGLSLERDVWLIEHPPSLRSRLERTALVEVVDSDGGRRELGELRRDKPFALPILATQVGVQTVAAAGYEFVFEVADRGRRAGVGVFAHRPHDWHLMRAGAVSQADADLYGDTPPAICGATVDGGGDREWRPPLTLRAHAPVHVIYRNGTVALATPSPMPQWARQAQLSPAGPWEIPEGDQAIWLCVQSRTHPRVIAVGTEEAPLTDEVIDIARWFSTNFVDAAIIDRAGGGADRRWRQLVGAALATDEEPAAGG